MAAATKAPQAMGHRLLRAAATLKPSHSHSHLHGLPLYAVIYYGVRHAALISGWLEITWHYVRGIVRLAAYRGAAAARAVG